MKKTIISPSEVRLGVYRFSAWQSIAKTYPEAVEKIFKAIEDTRPFKNYLITKNIRETPRKQEMLAKVTKDGVIEIEIQTGQKYKGKSVKEARELFGSNEFGLGAYEVACIVLAKPELLTQWEDLGIDCPGDEYLDEGDSFQYSPCLCFFGGRVKFGSGWFDVADDDFGSASAFLSQPLESRSLETSESLTLEFAIKICKENGLTVTKTY